VITGTFEKAQLHGRTIWLAVKPRAGAMYAREDRRNVDRAFTGPRDARLVENRVEEAACAASS
jgi:hypothetical protein